MTSSADERGPVDTRVVRIGPERLTGWIGRFADRHGPYEVVRTPPSDGPASSGDRVELRAADGTFARLALPAAAPRGTSVTSTRELIEVALAPNVVALLVVRKGGFSVGVAHGSEIVVHRTGSRYVQGRTAAGGSSQARFARRRANQATAAFAQAREAVEQVVLPHLASLHSAVAGGDRAAVRSVLDSRALRPLAELVYPSFAPVGEPKRVSLDVVLRWAREIPCEISESPLDQRGHDGPARS